MWWLIPYLLIYLVGINFIAFAACWFDKRRAQRNMWRVKERTLFTLGLAGGIWGLLMGMKRFHHKTAKVSFMFTTTLIILINLGYYYLIGHFGFGLFQ